MKGDNIFRRLYFPVINIHKTTYRLELVKANSNRQDFFQGFYIKLLVQ